MILGFGILSKAVSSPEILRFKVAPKFGTFAPHFVPSYDQSGEREPWPRNYQTLTNTPSSLRSLGVIIFAQFSKIVYFYDLKTMKKLGNFEKCQLSISNEKKFFWWQKHFEKDIHLKKSVHPLVDNEFLKGSAAG